MKIVQYMQGFRNRDGGVVRAVIDLCVHLAGRGHEVIAQTTDDSDAPQDWDGRAGNPKLQVLQLSRIVPALIRREALREAQRAFGGADILHLHVPWDPICIQLARLAQRMNIPYVLTVHGMLDDWTMARKIKKKRLYLALGGRSLLQRAACVQCSAQVEMEQSAKWFPHGRRAVVPLLFDLKPFEQLPGPELAQQRFPELFSAGDQVILYMGRLHPIKRVELLLDAAGQLMTDGVQCRVAIAGAGDAAYERQLREQVVRAGLQHRVAFLGFVTGDEKLSLYQAAEVAVHPSAHESFGFVTVEALACQTPVITTKAVNIWPELESSGGAIIADPNSRAIASALTELLGNDLQAKAKRQQMGRSGREWVFNHLHPGRVVGMYENMYREAIAR